MPVVRATSGFRPRLLAAAALLLPLLATAQPDPIDKPARILPLAPQAMILSAVSADGRFVAVGEQGIAISSTDGGATWQQGQVPLRSTLTGVFMRDAQEGWAVGHDAVILHTTDGGATWDVQRYAPEEQTPLLDVWFRDESYGIAIGAYGWYFLTEDGGENWEQIDFLAEDYVPPAGDGEVVPAEGDDGEDAQAEAEFDVHEETIWDDYDGGPLDFHLNRLIATPDGALLIAAEAGHLFRSTDDGATWVSMPTPYEGSYFGALPLESDGLLLFGLRGHLFRSDNGGVDWVEIDTGITTLLTGVAQLADGSIVVAGSGGTILESSDGGRAFTLHAQPDRLSSAVVLDAGGGSILLAGEQGVRLRSAQQYRVAD